MTVNENFTFNPGQVVKLKSGGPNMVVNGRGIMQPPQSGQEPVAVYTCAWIDKEERPQFGIYIADAIAAIQ